MEQNMADGPSGGTGCNDVSTFLERQYLGSDHTRGAGPDDNAENNHEIPKAGAKHRRHQNHQREERNNQHDISNPHQDTVNDSAGVSGHHPNERPNGHCYHGSDKAKTKRYSRAVHDLTEEILPDIVCSKKVAGTGFLKGKPCSFIGIIGTNLVCEQRDDDESTQDSETYDPECIAAERFDGLT